MVLVTAAPPNSSNRSTSNTTNTTAFKQVAIFGVTILVLLLGFLYVRSNSSSNSGVALDASSAAAQVYTKQADSKSETTEIKAAQQQDDDDDTNANAVKEGEIGGVGYYHCSAKKQGNDKVTSIVLLHGAAFTKEDWKKSGILQQFCDYNQNRLSVTALDLKNGSNDEDLRNVLDAINLDQQVFVDVTTPVALVTPSMSGGTIVSWMTNPTAATQASQYVSHWIPVAAGKVSTWQENDMETLRSSLPNILAIYGDKDAMGKRVSERLGTESNAKVVELVGTHPCYLDSPKEFVKTVLDYLFA